MDDARLTPARPDLAAKYLEGKVNAARFVEGAEFEIIESVAPLRSQPSAEAEQLTQALMGERITIYDRNDEGWAWGQLLSDGYVGWVADRALAEPRAVPTHKITVLRTLAFPGPSIKLPPMDSLPLGATVTVAREDDTFAITSAGGYIPKRHLVPLATNEPDFVAVAERFVNVPYLWGGKSALGIDCSGLVQVALGACGIPCPRDSDMQQNAFGTTIDIAQARRGDLVFWKGHVAIVRDGANVIHANAHHMAVAVEPIATALARITAAGSHVTSVKRV